MNQFEVIGVVLGIAIFGIIVLAALLAGTNENA